MLIPPNEAERAVLTTYSDYSNRSGDFLVTAGFDGVNPVTTLLIARIPTIFARNLIVAAFCNGAAVNATITIRKYFMAGASFVDETFVLVNGVKTVFSSSSPLEEAEVYITNNDLATGLYAYGQIIARH